MSAMTEAALKEYFAVKGSPFNKTDACLLGPWLEKIHAEHDMVTNDLIIDLSRPADSPGHNYIPWDADKALADMQNRAASDIQRAIRVRYISPKGRMSESPVLIKVSGALVDPNFDIKDLRHQPVQVGVTAQQVHASEILKAAVLSRAAKELHSFKRRYSMYHYLFTSPEWQALFRGIDMVVGDPEQAEMPDHAPAPKKPAQPKREQMKKARRDLAQFVQDSQ